MLAHVTSRPLRKHFLFPLARGATGLDGPARPMARSRTRAVQAVAALTRCWRSTSGRDPLPRYHRAEPITQGDGLDPAADFQPPHGDQLQHLGLAHGERGRSRTVGIEAALYAALTDAGARPEDVQHVNAHGTSTPLNDVAEGLMLHR